MTYVCGNKYFALGKIKIKLFSPWEHTKSIYIK